MGTIDTEVLSKKYREVAIDLRNKSILITNYSGSEQEKDFSEPANCEGFGRIRHFKLRANEGWPNNPLPIIPAAKALGLEFLNEIRAQVFQNSVCNWRCWYCFVDFKLLNGDKRFSKYITCYDLLEMYTKQDNRPPMIDLSGGQPDLTPEWVPWMIDAIKERGLEDEVFLWSDDNLSNDYFWRFLSTKQIDTILSYRMYSRVCCFKGIDEKSFQINTKAHPDLFYNQINLFGKLFALGIDIYGYITLTAPTNTSFCSVIPRLLDEIQKIHPNLPLRIIPLKILEFTPAKGRMSDLEKDCIIGQNTAIEIWQYELEKRFPDYLRNLPITEVLAH